MHGEIMPDMPPLERLHDVWRIMGHAKRGFDGPASFDWQDIQAFSHLTNIKLEPCEAMCLFDMSRAYVSALADRGALTKQPMERTDE